MPTPISQVFERLKSENKLAFMPFVTAGDPDLDVTKDVIRALGSSGVDLIEIGIPYSDPIADGPVIQASYTRALDSGISVSGIFEALKDLKEEDLPPRIVMVSYAIIFRFGLDRFLEKCVDSGVAGLIVPDLPGEEAHEFFTQVHGVGLDLIQLVAPTTPRARVKRILESCSGFVYTVAVAGTTGAREQVAGALLEQLEWLRQETELPLAVGFGISKPEHVEPLRKLAQGVIVGSAIVKFFQQIADGDLDRDAVLESVSAFSTEMAEAAHSA